MSADAYFELEMDGAGDRQALVLAGEMDTSTASEVSNAVNRLCDEGARQIVVDMRRLRFIDSSGLQVLLTAQKLCSERGCRFVLDPDLSDPVRRVFDISRAADLFTFE